MRNECQDVLIDARRRLDGRDYEGSIALGQLLLDGRVHCPGCPYGDECWMSALALVGEAASARARAHLEHRLCPAE